MTWICCVISDLPLDALTDGNLDNLDLLSHHRQHFELDAVKLVEAGPRTRLGQTLEELAHSFVVETVRAVEDDTL